MRSAASLTINRQVRAADNNIGVLNEDRLVAGISDSDRFTATCEDTGVDSSACVEEFFDSGRGNSHRACRNGCTVNGNGNRDSPNSAAGRNGYICAEVDEIIGGL